MTGILDRLQSAWQSNWPGIALAALIGVAASALGAQYGAPAMLFALLIGMAFHHLAAEPRTEPGVGVASRTFLRVGVALLGLRLSFEDIASLGWAPALTVALLVTGTVVLGVILARALGKDMAFGALAGGAVGICGASAALALAAVLPVRRIAEREVIFTVAAVTTLSTVAMVAYPVLFSWIGHDPREAGFLIGATIHDVAQVVGAGYSISEEAGDTATFVKLQRVALLPVAIIVVSLAFRSDARGGVTVPWYLTAFVVLVLANNLLLLPEALLEAARTVSGWLLVVAIAALGIKTSLAEMAEVGPRAATIVAVCTLALLVAALLAEQMLF